MYLLFEESGAFKTGQLIEQHEATATVELPTGRRLKIKRNHILLTFTDHDPMQLLPDAEREAEAIDLDFLWQVAPDDEFDYQTMAIAYYGEKASTLERTAMLLKLHSAPIYFHRRGRGRYRKAPPDILTAALIGLEKKQRRQQQIALWRDQLLAGLFPPEWQPQLSHLLYAPDRNRPETEALYAAAEAAGTTPVRLLFAVGALPHTYAYHWGRLLHELPFDPQEPPPSPSPPLLDSSLLPLASAPAFSIDDHTTTEIDDAFSLHPLPGGGWRLGIHIAAPTLSVLPATPLDRYARARMSTLYLPGDKITMLPHFAIERHTLAQDRTLAALSLYLYLTPALTLEKTETRLEQVIIAANLRLRDLEMHLNEVTLAAGLPEPFPWRDELKLLWQLALILEAQRGVPAPSTPQIDYLYYIDWARSTPDGPGHVTLVPRPRGAPIDKIVSELAIFANVCWGKLLAQHQMPALYRAQPPGEKVRITLEPLPHEGLGVPCYAWSTSPLRRYTDLINQHQLLAILGHSAPLSADAVADVISTFETRYAQYTEWQRTLERYWALRWLRQEQIETTSATLWRENIVRLEGLPLLAKVPSLPSLPPGARVEVAIEHIDLIDLDLTLRYRRSLPSDAP
ncbi:MAG: RNB domain-containing ribonuclease [Hydrogenophilus sp.]|nr:RNB domain-containing ribonuclease [Hydrogenophilus sp.]